MSDDEPVTLETIEGLAAAGNAKNELGKASRFVGGAFCPKWRSRVSEEPCMLGVDEAGRGPVLGPMVYGIAFCPIAEVDSLKALGCADSKVLTEEKREVIFRKMIENEAYTGHLGWAVDVISPAYISGCMLRKYKCSLNEVSMNSAIDLIKEAEKAGVNITEVYVDTVGPPEKYQAKLSQIFPQFKITVRL